MENFSAREAIGLAAVKASTDRTEMMESFADNTMMLRDTSLIYAQMLEPFLITRALGVQRILKRNRVVAAPEVAAAATEIVVAEAAAPAVVEEATAAFAAVVGADEMG